jgi:hypothetical protein
MVVSDSHEDLRKKVAELEIRLDHYHRELGEVIDQRDKVVLRRVWRFVDWSNLLVSLGFGAFVSALLLGLKGWVAGLAGGIIGFGIAMLIVGMTQRREKHDQSNFSELPLWRLPNWVK